MLAEYKKKTITYALWWVVCVVLLVGSITIGLVFKPKVTSEGILPEVGIWRILLAVLTGLCYLFVLLSWFRINYYWAKAKGYSGALWVFLSFLISLPIATLVLCFLSDKHQVYTAKKCLERLKGEYASMRIEAVDTLVKLGAKEHIEDIARLLKDEEARVRAVVAKALAQVGAEEYAKDIAGLLKDRKSYHDTDADKFMPVCYAIIKSLGELNAKEYADDIKPLLNDKDKDVRKAAEDVLRKWDVDIEKTTNSQDMGK